jgi:LacI family transcriptional regulator
LRSWTVDGAVFVGISDAYITKIQKEIQIPLIFFFFYTKQQKINNVGIDDFRGGVLAAEHFLSRGHRALGFVGYSLGEQKRNVVSERLLGFSSVLDKHGIKLTGKQCFYVSEGDPREVIQKIAAQLTALKGDITGVFVSADKLAIALMEALSEYGMNVPEDISIIGFDDLSVTANIVPGLTTIRQNISKKAQIATDLLFCRIEGEQPPRNPVLEVSLMERDSVSYL